MENINIEKIDTLIQKGLELTLEYTPKLALAILTLIIGLWIVSLIVKFTRKIMIASHVEATLIPFLTNLVSWILKLLLFISVASMIGIATTSFVAVLGAAGLAVGLALQGSLANFAGGVLILMFRPYRIGDLIEAQGHLGVVKEIQIFNTIMVNPQNRRVVIPNGALSNGSVTNYTIEGKVRVDIVVGISYGSDIDTAKEVLTNMLKSNVLVLDNPEPLVAVESLADSSVNLVVRPYCIVDDYWDVYFGVTEQAKKALDANNISIPFPQRDVHLFEHKA